MGVSNTEEYFSNILLFPGVSCDYLVMNDDTQGPETRALAELFRARRGVIQMSQAKIAEYTGMTQMSVSRKLKGTSPITIYEASLIARALDMDLAATLATALDMAHDRGEQMPPLVAHNSDADTGTEQEETEKNHP